MKNFIFALIPILLLISSAAAQELSDFSITTKISSDGASRSTITVSVEKFSGTIKIPVPYEISRLNYESNFGKVDCRKESAVYGTDVLCSIPNEVSGSFKVEFDVFDLVKSSDEKFFFKQESSIPLNSKRFSFRAILPDGMGLTGTDSVFPKVVESSSDGRNIFITWRKDNMSAGETFSGQIVYEPLSGSGGGPSGLIIAGSLLGLPIAVAFAFFYFRKFKERALTPSVVLPVLKEDEKKVVEGLVKHGSGVNQKIIVSESGYSKAKVSKVLKSLTERGIVKFERIGRSNRIYWNEEFKKKTEAN